MCSTAIESKTDSVDLQAAMVDARQRAEIYRRVIDATPDPEATSKVLLIDQIIRRHWKSNRNECLAQLRRLGVQA